MNVIRFVEKTLLSVGSKTKFKLSKFKQPWSLIVAGSHLQVVWLLLHLNWLLSELVARLCRFIL